MSTKAHAAHSHAPSPSVGHAHAASGVDWGVLTMTGGAVPAVPSSSSSSSASSSSSSSSSLASALQAHALLREVHLLSLDRHSASLHVQALQAQVAALEANLADAARMHATLQGKVQVLEYGLKIERKHNARLVAALQATTTGSSSEANGAAAAADGASSSSLTSHPPSAAALSELIEARVDPTLHDAYMAALPLIPAAASNDNASSDTLPRSLPAPAALGLQTGSVGDASGPTSPSSSFASSSSSSSSFSSSALSNATSALPSSSSGGADEGDLNFSYTRTSGGGLHRQKKSIAGSRGGGGGGGLVDVNATSALPPPNKPLALTANTFMPPSEEEIEAEIAMAKSPPGVPGVLLPGLLGSAAASPAGSAAGGGGGGAVRPRAESSSVSFSYSPDDGEAGRKASGSGSGNDPSAPTVYNYASPEAAALPSFGSGGAASSAANGTNASSPSSSSSIDTSSSSVLGESSSDLRLGQTVIDMRLGAGTGANASSGAGAGATAGGAESSASSSSTTAAPSNDVPAAATTNGSAASSTSSSSSSSRHARGASGALGAGTGTGTASTFANLGASGLTSAKQWRPKLQLKSHMDSVRSVCFDRNRMGSLLSGGTGAPPTLLLSGSEDGTAQLWNLSAALSATTMSRKTAGAGGGAASQQQQPMPLHSYRGHLGAVTSVLLHSGVGAFSAGVDGQVVHWSLPPGAAAGSPVDLYAQQGATSAFVRTRMKHEDAVWSMDLFVPTHSSSSEDDGAADTNGAKDGSGKALLATAVANGDVCVWEVSDASPESSSSSSSSGAVTTSEPRLRIRLDNGGGDGDDASSGKVIVPTAVQFVPSSVGQILAVATSTGALLLYDARTGALRARCSEPSADSSTSGAAAATSTGASGGNNLSPSRITALVAHPTADLLVTAHVDSSIRFWSVSSPPSDGSSSSEWSCTRVGFLAAHRAAVSCLSLDGSGAHLVSGSHDESIRVWSSEERKIRQVLDTHQTHRLKFAEAIHAVSFHPTQPYLASAGADGIVKLYV